VDIAGIRALEERAFNAWPSLQTVLHDGWLFRLSGGLTKRANSVNPLRPEGSVDAIRAAAEDVYAKQGLPTILRLTPLAPPEADRDLAAAGYDALDPSRVMVAPISTISSAISSDAPRDARVAIASEPSRAWLDGMARAQGIPAAQRGIHETMIGAIAMPTAFAAIAEKGEPIGFGLAVAERGAVGLFEIIVVPAHRGQGRGRAITHALLAWGRGMGADRAYLQVREQSTAALGLYTSLGFKEAYRYHYRGRAFAGSGAEGRDSFAP